jgi:hypothetical protein
MSLDVALYFIMFQEKKTTCGGDFYSSLGSKKENISN